MGQLSDNHCFSEQNLLTTYFVVLLRMLILNGTCLDKEMIPVEK